VYHFSAFGNEIESCRCGLNGNQEFRRHSTRTGQQMAETHPKQVSLGVALLIIAIIMLALAVGVGKFKIPTDMAFVLALTAITLVCMAVGFTLKQVQEFFFDGCKKSVTVAVLIMTVGMVIGSWIVSGVVPSLIFYGLKFISPHFFLVTGFLLLCTVSLFIGSTYATAGTIGVALMSIGFGMGYPPALTAGMVVSGSVFGNKISPFADTTNLCIAVTGVDLTDHIKSMLWSVLPVLVASSAIFTYLGMTHAQSVLDQSKIDLICNSLSKIFVISPWLLLIPVLTIALIAKRVPAVISLIVAALIGAVVGLLFQPKYGVQDIFAAISKGFTVKSGVPQVDSLLNRGGIASMMPIVTLIIFVLGLCEILQRVGVVNAILDKVTFFIRGTASLVLTTLATALAVDALTGSQYLSIILPGEMLKTAYEKARIKLNVLSRTLEDGGTIFSYLVPWSTPSLVVAGILGLPVRESFPYSYQLWLTPILAAFYGITGIAIWKEDEKRDNTGTRAIAKSEGK
jgi:NhaC family Na+:H+ antiporter